MRAWPATLLVLALLAPAPAWGEVYQWEDEEGVVHYATGIERVPERFRETARLLPGPAGGPPPADSAAPGPSGLTTIQFRPGLPILVGVRVNGAGPVTLILDTGADRTMISPAALTALGVPYDGRSRAELKGVTGTREVAVMWVGLLEVGQAKAGPLPILAHDAELKQAHGLLGRDFLDLFKVTIDSRAGTVTLAPH